MTDQSGLDSEFIVLVRSVNTCWHPN